MDHELIPEHDLREEFLKELVQGRKIEAIKLFRQMKNCGLKDAKQAVDQIKFDLAEQHPDEFARQRGAGCAASVAIAALGTAAAAKGTAWVLEALARC